MDRAALTEFVRLAFRRRRVPRVPLRRGGAQLIGGVGCGTVGVCDTWSEAGRTGR